MDKLKMMSMDNVQENIKKIQALFPNAVTEVLRDGKPTLAVDFDVLKQEMSNILIDDREERYQFTWPDKKKSILLANSPISATLRPCVEESVDFDNTQNLYIEGDNLDVLKLLQETYLGKIKMIYIDPPYNTGNDFVYNDDFAQSSDEYLANSGQYDDQGNRLVHNTDSNGRFHTDWLNMMYPRLKVAKDLLADDGVIFISIDDCEQHNARRICDAIFGETNFIAQCVRKRRDSQANLSKNISPVHEYIIIYSKRHDGEILNKVAANIDESDYKNPDNDPRGPYVTMPCTNKGGSVYSVETPTGKIITEEWRFKRETYDRLKAENRLVFPKGGEGKPRYKLFLSEKKNEGVLANTWLDELASNQVATREIKSIMGDLVFDTPKPVGLLKFCLQLATDKNSIILDFFSGSATTAHAVMQLNSEDGGNRKFIMVQLPEACDEKSEAYKAGYKNICEIGKERIRRAGKKIKDENPLLTQDLDTGFRVLKLDSSNMKDVFYRPGDYSQGLLGMLEGNIKEDRTPLDLLFQVMLELGKPLSAKIEEKVIAGKKVFVVDDNDLVACFDENITEEVVKTIAQMQPLYAVFRDNSFSNDTVAANFDQIFATYSPATTRRIL